MLAIHHEVYYLHLLDISFCISQNFAFLFLDMNVIDIQERVREQK